MEMKELFFNVFCTSMVSRQECLISNVFITGRFKQDFSFLKINHILTGHWPRG